MTIQETARQAAIETFLAQPVKVIGAIDVGPIADAVAVAVLREVETMTDRHVYASGVLQEIIGLLAEFSPPPRPEPREIDPETALGDCPACGLSMPHGPAGCSRTLRKRLAEPAAPETPEPPRFTRPGEDMLFHKDTCARWVNTEIGWSYSEATPCNCGLLLTRESRSPSAPLTAEDQDVEQAIRIARRRLLCQHNIKASRDTWHCDNCELSGDVGQSAVSLAIAAYDSLIAAAVRQEQAAEIERLKAELTYLHEQAAGESI